MRGYSFSLLEFFIISTNNTFFHWPELHNANHRKKKTYLPTALAANIQNKKHKNF